MIVDTGTVVLVEWVLVNLVTFVGLIFASGKVKTHGSPWVAIPTTAFFFIPMVIFSSERIKRWIRSLLNKC